MGHLKQLVKVTDIPEVWCHVIDACRYEFSFNYDDDTLVKFFKDKCNARLLTIDDERGQGWYYLEFENKESFVLTTLEWT